MHPHISPEIAAMPLWQQARYGLLLVFTDRGSEGMRIFKAHSKDLCMQYGYVICQYIEAILNNDEEKFNSTANRLEDLEEDCELRLKESLPKRENLEMRIIFADVKFLLSTINVKRGGIYYMCKALILLRSAWKMYKALESEMILINKELVDFTDELDMQRLQGSNQFLTSSLLMTNKSKPPDLLDKVTCARLMRSAAWGQGLIQLNFSLMSPAAKTKAKLLGLPRDRDDALAKLNYCMNGTDMRSILALLILLWYHTVIRSVLHLDHSHPQVCLPIAVRLLKRCEEEFGRSSLFLYFQGRVNVIKNDTTSAISNFYESAEITLWRELRMLALHDLGYCYMIQLRYSDADSVYAELLKGSSWSRCFYAYCLLINSAADFALPDVDDFESAVALYEHDPLNPRLEELVTTRRHLITTNKTDNLTPRYWRLLVYEVLYQHNMLQVCSESDLRYIIQDCELVSNLVQVEPFKGLSNLIAGSAYHILKDDCNAYINLKECLAKRRDTLDGSKLSIFTVHEMGRILNKENPLLLENVRYLEIKHVFNLQYWRACLRTCPPYKTINFNASSMLFLMIFVAIFFIAALLVLTIIPNQAWESNYNDKYPLTEPTVNENIISYGFAAVADLNNNGSKQAKEKGYWISYILKGRIFYNTASGAVSAEVQTIKELKAELSYDMKGFELSDLVTYNGKMYSADEKTGVVYELRNEDEYFPWVILMGGDGNNGIPFQCEWSSQVDESLYIGSLGRIIHATEDKPLLGDSGTKYVKRLKMDGSVTHINWVTQYSRIQEKMGFENGVVTHEAVSWSSVHKRWYFLPRRCSTEKWDEATYLALGCSKIVTTNEHIVDVDIIDVPTESSTRGFSCFRFLPNTDDKIIIALRTEITSEEDMATYITAFSIHGKMIMSDIKIADIKFEGFEFT